MLQSEPTLQTRLKQIGGVTVKSTDLAVKVSGQSSRGPSSMAIPIPGQLDDKWLPNGANCPCIYTLQLKVELTIEPAVLFRNFGAAIPGLSAPFSAVISSSHQWENLGRDPETGEFYLNE